MEKSAWSCDQEDIIEVELFSMNHAQCKAILFSSRKVMPDLCSNRNRRVLLKSAVKEKEH